VGGAVGGVVAICITVVLVALILRRHKRGTDTSPAQTPASRQLFNNQDLQTPYFSKLELDVPANSRSLAPPISELPPN
jgi:hypothetical protein